MPLREATYSDLLPASHALSVAFREEGLFGAYFHPHRHEYPDDMHLFFLRKLREDWAVSGPDHKTILASKTDDDGKDVITGVAVWQRKRAVPQPQSWTTAAWVKTVESLNKAEALAYPNRAADPSHFDVLHGSEPFIAHHWSGSRAESWYLDLLGVDPQQGGKGVGRELVAWGFEQAKKDGVGCSVIAAEGKETFYGRCGFDVIVGSAGDFGGMENPIKREGIGGGVIFFWDGGKPPSGLKEYGGK